MVHLDKKAILLSRLRTGKKRKTSIDTLLLLLNKLWRPVVITAFIIGFVNYWIYLYSIGRLDFLWGSLSNFNTFLIFSVSVIFSTIAMVFFLYSPSVIVFLIRNNKIGRGDFEPYLCLLMSFFFSNMVILLLVVAWGAIRNVFPLIAYTIFCLALLIIIINKVLFEVRDGKIKSIFIGMGCALYSLFCMAILLSLSNLNRVPEVYQFLATFLLVIIQHIPGMILFIPTKDERNKVSYFAMSAIVGLYIMFVVMPGVFFYAQLGSLKFMGNVDANQHVFQIPDVDFDRNFFNHTDWNVDVGQRCVQNNLTYQKKHLIVGTIGFRSGGTILICPPDYPKIFSRFLQERMFLVNVLAGKAHINMEEETQKCISLKDTPSLQQDALAQTFLYGQRQ